MVGLGDLPGGSFYSAAYGLSADGSTVAGLYHSGAFRWTTGTGMLSLSSPPAAVSPSWAFGASDNGSVIVGYGSSASGTEAFRWTSSGGAARLGDLAGGSFYSEARAVSGDGSVVVGYSDSASGNQAFRWTNAGGMVGLGDLAGGSFYSIAHAVSADGSVVVGQGSSDAGTEAFRWTSGGGMIGLGFLPGGASFSYARGVSGDGSVVVGTAVHGFYDYYAAFIWDSVHGTRSLQSVLTTQYGLDLTGWTLNEATAISSNGQYITGFGTDPNGNTQAWLVHIPEPNTYRLVALGGLALFLPRFARR